MFDSFETSTQLTSAWQQVETAYQKFDWVSISVLVWEKSLEVVPQNTMFSIFHPLPPVYSNLPNYQFSKYFPTSPFIPTPPFIRCYRVDKENYRPASVSSYVSKVFERLMYQQIENFMKDKLLNLLTGYRKNHSTQHCLMHMLERWKKTWINEVIYAQYLRICQRPLTHWTTIY